MSERETQQTSMITATLASYKGFHVRPLREIADSMRSIAEAIFVFHSLDFVHGAIEPQNIACKGHNEFALLDLARIAPIGRYRLEGTIEGASLSRYISPEAIRAFYRIDNTGNQTKLQLEEFKVDRSEDIWSFAVTLYSALTASPHFFSSTAEEVAFGSEEMIELLAWKGLTDTIAERFKNRRLQIMKRAKVVVNSLEEDDMMCWAREWHGFCHAVVLGIVVAGLVERNFAS